MVILTVDERGMGLMSSRSLSAEMSTASRSCRSFSILSTCNI